MFVIYNNNLSLIRSHTDLLAASTPPTDVVYDSSILLNQHSLNKGYAMKLLQYGYVAL